MLKVSPALPIHHTNNDDALDIKLIDDNADQQRWRSGVVALLSHAEKQVGDQFLGAGRAKGWGESGAKGWSRGQDRQEVIIIRVWAFGEMR